MTDKQAGCLGPVMILVGMLHILFAFFILPPLGVVSAETLLFDQAYAVVAAFFLIVFGLMFFVC